MVTFTISLTFSFELNDSIQVGDDVYWTSITPLGGFAHSAPNNVVMHIGTITAINQLTNTITVASPHVDSLGNPLPNISPPLNSFISFSKNNVVNNNDLTGYYSSIQFVNDSVIKAELFSVGSGVSESSK